MGLNQGFVYRERVGPEIEGLTVLEHLERSYRHSSIREWRERIDQGRVRVNGSAIDPGWVLRSGQELTWHRPPWEEPEAPTCFAVLYQDEHLVAVAKPRGLASLPGGGFLTKTLLSLVRKRYPEASPLHRLGRGTSGLVLFARTVLARSFMTAAWQKAEVTRIYRALIQGRPEPETFTVDSPIGPVSHALLGRVQAASRTGKPALSRVRILGTTAGASIAEVAIETGRPHQIRIHLAVAGHPLVGDRLYPSGGVPSPDSTVLPGEIGYWLHAAELRFSHPRTGRPLVLSCLPPPVLRGA